MSAFRPSLRAYLPRILVLAVAGLLAGAGVAGAATTGNEPAPPDELTCEQGEFCTWPEEFYGGEPIRSDLRTTNPEECVPLPDGVEARSFANRIDRHVTVYQDRDCSTEGDFTTYPGGGTFVPQAPFVVRAIQIWN